MGQIILEEQVTADTPASNMVAVYPKAGGGLYKIDDTGDEVAIGENRNYVSVNDADRLNTTLTTDFIVGFIALSAQRTYQISSEDIAQVGRKFKIKDEVGGARTNNIVITTEGAETIDGAASVTITSNYGAITLYSNGSNLFIY